MKTIIGIEKRKKGYMVSFDHETFLVFPEVYIKHHLKPGLSMDQEAFDAFIKDHMWITYLDMGLSKLKKMMTVFEMSTFLEEKGAPKGLNKQLIHYMIERKYLNDLYYVKTYIEMKKYQEGPNMLIHKLKEKGISNQLIESHIAQINEYDILKDLMSKKIVNETKKTKQQTLKKLKETYIKKGFTLDVVESVLIDIKGLYQGDEKALLEKDFYKIKTKLEQKYQGYELIKKIKEKLYQKGYAYEAIKTILREDN